MFRGFESEGRKRDEQRLAVVCLGYCENMRENLQFYWFSTTIRFVRELCILGVCEGKQLYGCVSVRVHPCARMHTCFGSAAPVTFSPQSLHLNPCTSRDASNKRPARTRARLTREACFADGAELFAADVSLDSNILE